MKKYKFPLNKAKQMRSADFLRKPDENSFGPTDVTEAICIFILDYFADELRAARVEFFKYLVNVINREHSPKR